MRVTAPDTPREARHVRLVARLEPLEDAVGRVLARGETAGETAGDERLVLLAVREGRNVVEVLAKLATQGEIEERLAALEAHAHSAADADTGDADVTNDHHLGAATPTGTAGASAGAGEKN